MGMDGVEIVMLAEERFGIRIADREAENVRTPGMLVDLVMGKLGEATKEMCQSQRSFYLLRRGIMRIASVDRKAIELRTSVRGFVARNNEQIFWMQLKAQIAARSWPTLGLARDLEIARNMLLIIVCTGAIAFGWRIGFRSSFDATGATLTAIAAGVFITALAASFLQQLGKPFEKFIPSRISTVRDLLPFAATSNAIEWSRTDVSRVVKEIVEEILSPGEGKYREEADFVKELGLE